MEDFTVILWCWAIGAFVVIGFLIGVAVHRIREKEKAAVARGGETSISAGQGCLSILLPLVLCGPVLYLFIVAYLDNGGVAMLVLSLIVALFIVSVILMSYAISLKSGNEELDNAQIPLLPKDGKKSMRTSTKAMISIMAAKKLEEQLDKEKEERERDRYESLYWQESARDEMREDDYDYSDSSYDDDSDDADD